MRSNRFFLTYISLIFIITIILAFKPDYNWDMLPYMCILQKMDGVKSFDQIHAHTYAEAKKNISKKKYDDLVDVKNNYRRKMSEDAAAFETQLPFFDIKPIYLLSAFIFYKIGISLTFATVLPSLISFFFINLISFFWCRKFNLSSTASIIALVVICVITIPLAIRSNPDTLACLFLLISSYLFLEFDNIIPCILFLIFSILTRPENIIFSFLLFAIVLAGKWRKSVSFSISISALLIMAIVYYLPIKVMHYPGWNNLFYHAFVDNTADPSIQQTITLPVYFKVIQENILNIKGIIGIVCLMVLSAFILLQKEIIHSKEGLYKLFYVVVVIWATAKTLLFPMTGLRFVIPPVLLLFFVVIKQYELRFQKKPNHYL